MKRFLPILLIVGLGLIAWDYSYVREQALTVRACSLTTVKNVHQSQVTERILTLPEDGKVFYTTLFLPQDWQSNQESRRLRAWFDTNRSLVSLKAQTKFNVVTNADPQWNARYAASVPHLPCIALTDADGAVVYKASGTNVPKSATALAGAIASDIQKRCPNGRCPWDEEPEIVQPAPVIPDTTPVAPVVPEVPEKEDFPLWLGLLLSAAGVGFGVGPDIMKKYKSLG